jgi:hypothetical protein
VFILKIVKVLYFDILLQMFILKVYRVAPKSCDLERFAVPRSAYGFASLVRIQAFLTQSAQSSRRVRDSAHRIREGLRAEEKSGRLAAALAGSPNCPALILKEFKRMLRLKLV